MTIVVRFWSVPESWHVSHLTRTVRNRRQDIPAEHLPETPRSSFRGHSSFRRLHRPEGPILWAPSRAPLSRSRCHSFQGYQHPKVDLPAPSKTTTTTDLVDLRLQFSKQKSLNTWSQLRRQIILHFEHCNSSNSSADDNRRQQKSLPTIKDIIRAVTKKSQRANHAVIEIRTIRYTNYDSQGIYTLRFGPKKDPGQFKPY